MSRRNRFTPHWLTRHPLAIAGSVALIASGVAVGGALGADRSSRAVAQVVPGADPSVASVVPGISRGATNTYSSPRFEATLFGIQFDTLPLPEVPGSVEFGDERPDPSSPDTSHTYTGHVTGAMVPDIGAVWGLAYAGGNPTAAETVAKSPRSFYAAYAKSQTRFGPLGPGGIYVRSGSTVAPYVTIPTTVSATGDVADPLGGVHSVSGLDGVASVGKVSLGDLEIDPNERFLYVTNLRSRTVYSVDTRSASPQSTVKELPASPNPCTDPNNFRPFGLKAIGSYVLLASVCSGESSAADSSADVYAYNTATSTWSTTPALRVSLEGRGIAAPWVDSTEPNVSPATAMMFTSLDITTDGDLILGFRSRVGDMVVTDNPNLAPIGNGVLTIAKSTGALTWGSFFEVDAYPSQTSVGFVPPSPPYFYSDSFDKGAYNPQGAVVVVPQTRDGSAGSEVVTTQRDVFNYESMGVSFFDQARGNYTVDKKTTSREELYRGRAPQFGKASGIGDLELLATWRAFGDFVWRDTDRNGQQGAGESGVAGVKLSLTSSCASTDVLATVTTNATGGYTFYGAPFQGYAIKVDASNYASGGALAGLEPTVANSGADELDSDADATGCITVPAAPRDDVNPTFDIGVSEPAPDLYAIGDKVWIDANSNGRQDAGEAGIKDVVVELVGTTQTTTTDANGLWSFDNLAAGTYRVKFSSLPTGYTFTQKGTGTADGDSNAVATGTDAGLTDPFTVGPVGATLPNMSATVPAGLAAVAIDPTIDAGVVAPPVFYAVGDRVWVDANGNDRQDTGETGFAGVTVTLVQAGADLRSTTTDASGAYRFDGLSAGSYQVRFTIPATHVFVNKGDGSAAADDSNAATAGATAGLTDAFTLGPVSTSLPNMSATVPAGANASAIDPTIDAGIKLRPADPLYAIGDRVWFDQNHNGLQDAGETGVAGVSVELRPASGAVRTTTTDANGNYLFDGLAAGSYVVAVSAPSTYRFTVANVAGTATNSDVAPATGVTATIQVGPGAPNMSTTIPAGAAASAINDTIDAGLWQPLAIGDIVFNDANSNGRQDAGEAPVSGVRVELLDEANGQARNADGTLVAPVTTDATGRYVFDNLLAGTYRVRFSQLPAGFNLTVADSSGVEDNADSDADAITGIAPVTLGTGNLNLAPVTSTDNVAVAVLIDRTVDAGVTQPRYSLGNRVWFDQNGDGVNQIAEPGLDSVLVSLFSVSETGSIIVPALATTVTSSGGYYRFDNLSAGTFVVQIDGINFGSTGALAGFQSVGIDEFNPDADVDGNDNGIGNAGGPDAIVSNPVTITGNEPLAESDLGVGGQGSVDAQANMTVDFGFTTVYNLAIDKALLTPELGKGSTAKYRLTVTNTSPVAANNVVVTDPLPTSLRLVRATGEGWSCSNQGQLVTCGYGEPIPAGGTASFDLDAEVLVENGEIVNFAQVNSPRDSEDPQADNRDDVRAVVVTLVLPRTGSSGVGSMMVLAGGLALFGAALVLADRKRSSNARA